MAYITQCNCCGGQILNKEYCDECAQLLASFADKEEIEKVRIIVIKRRNERLMQINKK